VVVETNKGHGRREVRTLHASHDLNNYLDWPYVGQVAMVEREWWDGRGRRHYQVRYLITSLASANAAQLLAYKRGHWQIENGLHYVRDETLGEDRSQVRKGGPAVMAAVRNTAIGLLRRAGERNIAAATRRNQMHPHRALQLIGLQLLRKGPTSPTSFSRAWM